jgi:hypothetical protein
MPFAHKNSAGKAGLVPSNGGELRRLSFRVGGTSFDLSSSADIPIMLDPCLRDFETEPNAGDVTIQVSWKEKLALPSCAPLFDSSGLWSVFEECGGYCFYFSSPQLGLAPYKAAQFDAQFRRGHVVLCRPYFDAASAVYPLEYPLDELLMIHRLALGEGVEVHALGVVDDAGLGHLFLGHSGAGKSTTARLWKAQPHARILSDDRIILRVRNGRVWMYGTPWHGDAGVASPESAPLSRIYLLEHGSATKLIPVSRVGATAELFARSFVPHHSSSGVNFTLQFLDRVVQEIPCFTFRFVPDQSALEVIRRAAA